MSGEVSAFIGSGPAQSGAVAEARAQANTRSVFSLLFRLCSRTFSGTAESGVVPS